jgi:hypothetical protein
MMNPPESGPRAFPSLPIVTPDPPGRSQLEKYGLLFYLGAAGLVVVVTLVGWFGYQMWIMRDVWAKVHVLHDSNQTDEARIQAAFSLSRDPRVEQSQLWDMSLRRGLPELARYVLAERIGPELVAQDPQGYVSAVARSPEWPAWLRMALARPLAYASTEGHAISRERLGEICRQSDPILRLWALYTLAVQSRPDPQTVVEIRRIAQATGPQREFAAILLSAVDSAESQRKEILDRASLWIRDHHSETRVLWQGWAVRDQKLIREAPG